MESIIGYTLSAVILSYIIYNYYKHRKIVKYLFDTQSIVNSIIKKKLKLMPDLVRFIRDYDVQDSELVKNLTELCSIKYDKCHKRKKLKVSTQLEQVIAHVNAITPMYPELSQDEKFVNLMNEIQNIDNTLNSNNSDNTPTDIYNSILNNMTTNVRNVVEKLQNENMPADMKDIIGQLQNENLYDNDRDEIEQQLQNKILSALKKQENTNIDFE